MSRNYWNPAPQTQQIRRLSLRWGVCRERATLIAELCYGGPRQ